jgi:hypothetical protein
MNIVLRFSVNFRDLKVHNYLIINKGIWCLQYFAVLCWLCLGLQSVYLLCIWLMPEIQMAILLVAENTVKDVYEY